MTSTKKRRNLVRAKRLLCNSKVTSHADISSVFVCRWASVTDREASTRGCSMPDVVPNGVECDSKRRSPEAASEEEEELWAKENGVSDSEPPHGSVVGSNGFILAKPQQQQQQQGVNSSTHRTNCLPSGSLRTGPSARAASGQAMADSRNRPGSGSAPSTPAVTIHRARKTMSRPAVSPAQKVKLFLHLFIINQ